MGLKKLPKCTGGTHLAWVDLRPAERVVVGTHDGSVECYQLSFSAEDHCIAETSINSYLVVLPQ